MCIRDSLWVSIPSGLILSCVAKGGWLASLGFAVTGILWWWATWSGYRAVRNQQLVPHICWMVRSYALALSAVAFRVIQQLVVYAPISDDANYIVSLWLSLLASFWFSESCIRRQFVSDEKRRKIPKWFSLFSQSNTTLAKSKLTLKKQTV